MTKLERLINEFCPDGVEYKALGDVVEILDSQRKPVTKKDRQSGIYPYYGANGIQDYVNDYIFDGTFLLMGEDGSVINKDNTPVLTWATGKIWVNNHAHIMSEKSNIALLRYIYFYLSTADVSHIVRGTPPKINQQQLRPISIPLPPLPVQREIVRILDNFTELTAELTARKKQYEYYRDKLLTFGDEVPRVALGEVCVKTRNITWKDTDGEYYYIDLTSVDRETNEICPEQIINAHNAPSRAQQIIQTNDVLFATTRPTLQRYCFVPEQYDGQICSTGYCILRANPEMIMPKFLYYTISTKDFGIYVENNQKGASYPAITDSQVKKYRFPLPSLKEQARIVEVLNRFDKLCNDISEGLPAEIEARRKQYEYYRDKLLTFKEAGA